MGAGSVSWSQPEDPVLQATHFQAVCGEKSVALREARLSSGHQRAVCWGHGERRGPDCVLRVAGSEVEGLSWARAGGLVGSPGGGRPLSSQLRQG